MVWRAFLDFRLNAISLSALDIDVLKGAMNAAQEARLSFPYDVVRDASTVITDHPRWHDKEKCRERDECIEKLKKLGITK